MNARTKLLPVALLLACLLATLMPAPALTAEESPLLLRIQIVTVGTDDVAGFTSLYTRWLNYQTHEQGQVSPELAASWGTPQSAGRDYALMHSEGTPDVWLRVVEVDVPQPHKAMTTVGWSVIEFLVEDPDAVVLGRIGAGYLLYRQVIGGFIDIQPGQGGIFVGAKIFGEISHLQYIKPSLGVFENIVHR